LSPTPTSRSRARSTCLPRWCSKSSSPAWRPWPAAWAPPARKPPGASALGRGRLGQAPHQLGLAVGSLVAVDDTLGGRLVDPLHGQARRFGGPVGALLGGGDGGLDARLDLRPHRLVAEAAALVLAVALDLALDVGHGGARLHECFFGAG